MVVRAEWVADQSRSNGLRSQIRNMVENAGGVRGTVWTVIIIKPQNNVEEGYTGRLGNECAAIVRESVGSTEDGYGGILCRVM